MSNQHYQVITPSTDKEFADYYALRYQLLRKPWGQVEGSEQDALEEQGIHRMICDSHGEVVAVGRLHKVDITTAQIRYMAVAKKAQGQGLGSKMLQALEQAAVEHGVKRIELNAREVALNFYRQNNYQLHHQVHTLYGEVHHFLMSKDLGLAQTCPQAVCHKDWLDELTKTWQQTIPAANAQQITPVYYDKNRFVVAAPKEVTKNLHNTIFAGSIYTLATLAGWGWVYLQLKQQNLDADIVLGKADIKYLKPLHGEPVAQTSEQLTSGHISVIKTGQTAKITIKVDVCDGDQIAAVFTGTFFAIAKNE